MIDAHCTSIILTELHIVYICQSHWHLVVRKKKHKKTGVPEHKMNDYKWLTTLGQILSILYDK